MHITQLVARSVAVMLHIMPGNVNTHAVPSSSGRCGSLIYRAGEMLTGAPNNFVISND